MDNPLMRKHLAERRTEMTGGDELVADMNRAGQYRRERDAARQRIAELESEAAALRAALEDVLSGWQYVRWTYGDLYGVGWDRAESKAKAALSGDAGKRLLEAVRVLADLAGDEDHCLRCNHGWNRCDYVYSRRAFNGIEQHDFESAADQARATLRELGVLEGE